MYSDILIPTDGSPGAQVALEHGIEIASRFDVTIQTLYVVDTGIPRSGPLLKTLREEGSKAVREVEVTGAQSGRTVVTDIAEGIRGHA